MWGDETVGVLQQKVSDGLCALRSGVKLPNGSSVSIPLSRVSLGRSARVAKPVPVDVVTAGAHARSPTVSRT